MEIPEDPQIEIPEKEFYLFWGRKRRRFKIIVFKFYERQETFLKITNCVKIREMTVVIEVSIRKFKVRWYQTLMINILVK